MTFSRISVFVQRSRNFEFTFTTPKQTTMPKSQLLFYPRIESNKANWESLTSPGSELNITDCVCNCLNSDTFKARYPYDSGASVYFWEAIDPEEANTMNRKILNIPQVVVSRLQTMLDNKEINLDHAAYKVCKIMRNTLSVKHSVCRYWQHRLDRYKRVRQQLRTRKLSPRINKEWLDDQFEDFIDEHKLFPRFASFNKEVIFPHQQHLPFPNIPVKS